MFNNISKCFTCHANLTFIQIKFVKKVWFNSPGRVFQLKLLSKYTNLHKKHIREHNRQLGNRSNEEFRMWTKSIHYLFLESVLSRSSSMELFVLDFYHLFCFEWLDFILGSIKTYFYTSFLKTKYKICFDSPGMIPNSYFKNSILKKAFSLSEYSKMKNYKLQ